MHELHTASSEVIVVAKLTLTFHVVDYPK